MIPTTWFLPKINTDPIHTKSLHTFFVNHDFKIVSFIEASQTEVWRL